MRLLSVDWDYFFPVILGSNLQLYDWGHRDTNGSFFNETIWHFRAAGFLGSGLPLPGSSGAEKTFWQRFRFSRRCELYFADSHLKAIEPQVAKGVIEVWNFDAHHDCGYNAGVVDTVLRTRRVDCGSWMIAYRVMVGAKLVVRYPIWSPESWGQPDPPDSLEADCQIDDGLPVPVTFGRVLVARSAGWVPPWLDQQFLEFLEAAPIHKRIDLGLVPRKYDQVAVDVELARRQEFLCDHPANL